MTIQAVFNVAEICAQHGITDVVLSPGSRSAPLTLAFARHPALTVRVVPDERAAAFIGLGIAQAQRRAVALVCTSGTAGLNYAPAVAEAFFQHIPLVIFTADRPPEWIDQLDGQTIRQRNLYGAHAKGEFEFPVDTSHADAKWHSARIVNEAINLAQAAPAGPVQVNVPLREPFYPKAGEEIGYETDVKVTRELPGATGLTDADIADFTEQLHTTERVLIVAGQQPTDEKLTHALQAFSAAFGTPVVGDTIANLDDAGAFAIGRQDIFLAGLSKEAKAALRPDLLITFGQSLISKSLKLFLRDVAPKRHWHIQATGAAADTFRSLTSIVRVEPAAFFARLAAKATARQDDAATPWFEAEKAADYFLKGFFAAEGQPFNEFSAFYHTLAALAEGTALHLANSMAVRYANIIGIPQGKHIEVFANRGTSGIDGCNSTAVGAALAQPNRPVVLLTGDVAFSTTATRSGTIILRPTCA
ncbi:2-succinyl-5-enolpyruvyl-6-hydroxy-3-cyclohexene-1-carboxylic-acid synthase [Hymenobacter humi]|uniref:2-succinyl-5-enolpyruvyl-6-hydroxy-3-cyclohexene-1-carboxylic-acid synthase n=1 Tax=Hymenobacter humi TaxID=1411620 RepID=A0ABW2U7E3_9BACT